MDFAGANGLYASRSCGAKSGSMHSALAPAFRTFICNDLHTDATYSSMQCVG